MKVLIVDDETVIRDLVRYNLERSQRFEVMTAKNCKEALPLFYEHDPVAIILDIRMPGENGLDFLERVRQVDKNVVIFIHTAYGDARTRDKAKRAGADYFFNKPANYARIIGLISNIKPKAEPGQREISALYTRLERLKEKAAYQGLDAPVSLTIEIEQIERKIKGYNDR